MKTLDLFQIIKNEGKNIFNNPATVNLVKTPGFVFFFSIIVPFAEYGESDKFKITKEDYLLLFYFVNEKMQICAEKNKNFPHCKGCFMSFDKNDKRMIDSNISLS